MPHLNEDMIFGTPPEPHFNHKSLSLSAPLLEEWLTVLSEENCRRVSSADPRQLLFRKGHASEVIFLVCDKLRLRNDAKYIAVELFNRFMIQHVKDLYKHVCESSSRTKRKDWLGIMERVQNQLILRILSCCQLASKLSSHYRVVTVARVQRFLAGNGQRYTSESLLKSELRVLKTLDFKVNVMSPLTYLECLLEIIGHNEPGTEVKVYHGVSVKLLDLVYMKHEEIFNRLYQTATHHSSISPADREKLAGVEADKMLLAVGIITASVFIIDQGQVEKVLLALEKISQIPQEDIMDFCTVLVTTVAKGGMI
ncbi:cyclin N-terminal domain-containing protein 1-like isoform X2 [Liolophura sinensis]